jgi:hypothetical protein
MNETRTCKSCKEVRFTWEFDKGRVWCKECLARIRLRYSKQHPSKLKRKRKDMCESEREVQRISPEELLGVDGSEDSTPSTEFFTEKQVCKLCNVGPKGLLHWVRIGYIPAPFQSCPRCWKRSVIIAWIESGCPRKVPQRAERIKERLADVLATA